MGRSHSTEGEGPGGMTGGASRTEGMTGGMIGEMTGETIGEMIAGKGNAKRGNGMFVLIYARRGDLIVKHCIGGVPVI